MRCAASGPRERDDEEERSERRQRGDVGSPIVGCPVPVTPATAPCLVVVSEIPIPMVGMSPKVLIGGKPALLAGIDGVGVATSEQHRKQSEGDWTGARARRWLWRRSDARPQFRLIGWMVGRSRSASVARGLIGTLTLLAAVARCSVAPTRRRATDWHRTRPRIARRTRRRPSVSTSFSGVAMPPATAYPSAASGAGHGRIRLRPSGGFAPAAASAPAPPPMPTGTSVGHGTIRLVGRPPAYSASLTPGAPPPTQETAGVGHGRIRLRV